MPQSQKADARPIAFALHDVARNKPQEIFTLAIRPEDLTRNDPVTSVANQTLGGAWVDSGPPGLSTVNIAGTTGWRGAGDQRDGLALFQELHAVVFSRWHQMRDEVAKEGKDPNDIKLIFSDGLDGFSWVVKPEQFTLRKNKNRPLLSQYQIAMTKLGDGVLEKPQKVVVSARTGMSSLDASIAKINEFAANIKGRVASALGPMADGVKGLVRLTSDALQATRKLIAAGSGVVSGTLGPVMEIARGLTGVATNVFRMAASAKNMPLDVKRAIMETGAAFSNAMCLLRNAFNAGGIVPDYRPLFGSSSCSSTSGGRPLSPYLNTNVFPLLHPAAPSPVSLSAGAEQAIGQLSGVDVLNPPAATAVAGMLNTINSGVAVSGEAVDKAISAASSASKSMGAVSGSI